MKKFFLFFCVAFVLAVGSAAAQTEKAVSLSAGEYQVFNFSSNGQQIRSGRFRARGGSGNDVEVYIVDDDGLENFKAGSGFDYFWRSGRRSVGSWSVRLARGNYHLIVSNTFSAFATKAVALTLQ